MTEMASLEVQEIPSGQDSDPRAGAVLTLPFAL